MASKRSDQGDNFEHVVALDPAKYLEPRDFHHVNEFLRSDRATGLHTFYWDDRDDPHFAFSDANTAFAFKIEFG